jgi:hypothetical protein
MPSESGYAPMHLGAISSLIIGRSTTEDIQKPLAIPIRAPLSYFTTDATFANFFCDMSTPAIPMMHFGGIMIVVSSSSSIPLPEIVIPPSAGTPYRRIILRALRALSTGQTLGFKIYDKLTRMIKQHRRMTTYFGATFECDLVDLIPNYIYHFGVWEPNISNLIQTRLKAGDVFCDIGANIGYHSLLASKLFGNH